MDCKSLFVCLSVLFSTVEGYPISPGHLDNKIEFKNEKRYPNGTVIGKYTYKDKDGNPIHVKYYADDSSYSVELNSVKIFDGNSEMAHDKLPKFENTMTASDMIQPLEEISTINTMIEKEFNKNKTYNPFEVLNSYTNKINRYKEPHKADDNYEIFLENDLKPSGKCNKEKVKVYLDKNKRKIRNAQYLYKPSAYCDRF